MARTRKLGTVNFHPTAQNVLIASGADTLRLWDIIQGSEAVSLSGHTDSISGISVSYQGNLLAASSRDKHVRIYDIRSKETIGDTTAHGGLKGSRVSWLGAKPHLVTVGFSKSSEREFKVWDTRSFENPLATHTLDLLAGIITPFYDEDTGVLYLAGRGDASIKMFELVDDAPYAHFLTEYSSSVPQMGVARFPKQSLDIRGSEIARFIKVADTSAEPIHMNVPRTRMEFFQDDIFPPTRAQQPAYTNEELFSPETPLRDPPLEDLQPDNMTPLSRAPAQEKKPISFLTPKVVDNTPSRDQVYFVIDNIVYVFLFLTLLP